jgi:hypothetical protein
MRVDCLMETCARRAQRRFAVAALVMMTVAAACGRDALDFSGLPDGGASPTKDAAATKTAATAPSTTAAATAPSAPAAPSSPECALPKCFAKLVSPCTAAGACQVTYRNPVNGAECYANGVRALFSSDDPAGTVEARVYAANGGLCYSYTVLTPSSESTLYTFRDGRGEPVAAGQNVATGIRLTCPGELDRVLPTSCPGLFAGKAWGSTAACAIGACK